MTEYSDKIEVAASPEAVFRFVSDVNNLPKYLPTVHHANSQAGGWLCLRIAAHSC